MKKVVATVICFLSFLQTNNLQANNLRTNNWKSFKKQTLDYQKNIPGWCCEEKAIKMMDLIYETNPKVCVEIGVFGGSSIHPTAQALRYQQNGMIYAIDPWQNIECTDGYTPGDPNYQWWNKIDLEKIYKDFITMIHKQGLSDYCCPLRMTSETAAQIFPEESIDILHIDGNHSEEKAFKDAELWLPKVRKNGYIWFDDCNWNTTKKAQDYVKQFAIIIEDKSLTDKSCLLFQKL